MASSATSPPPATPKTSEPKTSTDAPDTGLHTAMRALLGIVAGLIVSELLKSTVGSMLGDWPPNATSAANGFLLLAATIFVIRVLSDNLLYYTARDAITPDDAYGARIFLLLCDLTSYALCYAIVLRLPDSAKGGPFPHSAMLWAVLFFALVEALHAVWCAVGMRIIRTSGPDTEKPRANLLKCWMRLSSEAAITWLIVLAVLRLALQQDATVNIGAATAVLAVSILSAARYLHKMREPYMGRPMVEPCDSRKS